jgi:hypothetical protein
MFLQQMAEAKNRRLIRNHPAKDIKPKKRWKPKRSYIASSVAGSFKLGQSCKK